MTKEQILERLKSLEADKAQLVANLQAYEGAIQDCNYWLKEIEESKNNE